MLVIVASFCVVLVAAELSGWGIVVVVSILEALVAVVGVAVVAWEVFGELLVVLVGIVLMIGIVAGVVVVVYYGVDNGLLLV